MTTDAAPSRLARALRLAGAAAAFTALVLPKALLLDHARARLWVDLGPWEALRAVAPDAILAAFAAATVARARRPLALAAALLLPLALLLADARVRELWLAPLGLDLAAYALRYSGDLASGSDAFFRSQAGLGMTFRRAAALAAALLLAGGVAAALARLLAPAPARPAAGSGRAALALAGALVAVALAPAPDLPYRLESSPFVRPLEAIAATLSAPAHAARLAAARFEQPPRPLDAVLGAAPRRLAADARPFRNVLLVSFESLRWRGLDLGAPGTPAPHLSRLAGEGILARCRVPVPHSSKALYALATGLYPFPGIEMREATRPPRAPWLATLKAERGARTLVLSVESLEFEALGRVFAGAGLDDRRGPEDLVRLAGRRGGLRSSFAEDDALLADAAPDVLARVGAPFFALVITGSSHHPYLSPGKSHPEDASLDAYRRSVAYADAELARLLAALDARGLLEDTVVAVVGDHGESFGEHGTWIHNSSVHDEETVVPLVLWSKDGRLSRAPGAPPLEARSIDVAPTLADLLGASGRGAEVQGVSLLREAPAAAFASTFFDGVALSVVEGARKHILEPATGRVTAYDLAADPDERSPRAVAGAERDDAIARLEAFRASCAALHEGDDAGARRP